MLLITGNRSGQSLVLLPEAPTSNLQGRWGRFTETFLIYYSFISFYVLENIGEKLPEKRPPFTILYVKEYFKLEHSNLIFHQEEEENV